ncbi:MAG: hypothetical protein PHD87_06755 [Candidatus Cloacimonetes bacterium]|nr:hypothetical protein [Candidatus Cloacimonadota bacterium]MDD4224267.1 hypothetical protein [Candidatus Cloacimonadota bacterium]
MKRGPLLLLMLLTAFQALACVAQEGELRVRNRSAGEIWVSVDNSEPRRISGWSNWSLFYKESRVLSVSYIGNYVFPEIVEQTVRAGLIATVDVIPSGGAITFDNTGSLSIVEVYISPTTELDWGPNDLAGSLEPGQNTLWTVTEGTWDLKLVDAEYHEYYKYGIAVTANQTQSLDFSEFGKDGDTKNPSPGQPTGN